MKQQLSKGQRAYLKLQILRTAKKNPEFEKLLTDRMNAKLNQTPIEQQENDYITKIASNVERVSNVQMDKGLDAKKEVKMFPIMKILRWLAVLPVACLAFVITAFLFEIFLSIFIGSKDMAGWEYRTLVTSASNYSFIYFGFLAAPNRKKLALLILTGIMAALNVFLLVSAWNSGLNIYIITASSFLTIYIAYRILVVNET